MDDEAGKPLRNVEYWVDFVQFKFAMTLVFQMLDSAILKANADGRIAKL